MSPPDQVIFFLILACIMAGIGAAKRILHRRLLDQPTESTPILADTESLRPAEIAYLSSRGDVSHVLLVLGADLVQKVVKSKLSGQTYKLESYEVNMWDVAKRSVGDWAQAKVDKHLPSELHKDPVEYVRRIGKLYDFLAHTVRAFVVQILADPAHIRKYFRFSAIASLVADFSTAGYKAAFESQFKANLINRGLLVSREARVRYSNYSVLVAIAAGVALAALTLVMVHPWPLALLMITLGFIGGGGLRAALLLVHLIPLYTEIEEVIAHLQRKSWRLNALRILIRAISGLSITLMIVVTGMFVGLFALIFVFIFGRHDYVVLLMFTGLILAYLAAFQLVLDGWKLAGSEMPSKLAESKLKTVRQKLKTRRPLLVFKELLLTNEYESDFSEILALYGIETLLLLA